MRATWASKVSLIDREAFVEYLLLEDLKKFYEDRLEAVKHPNAPGESTRAGQMAKAMNVEKFSAMCELFKSATDVAAHRLLDNDFSSVWRAIPEHALLTASSNVKNLPKLRAIVVDLLRELQEAQLASVAEVKKLNEALDDVEAHDANARLVCDLPDPSVIEETIKAAELAIPDAPAKKQKVAKPDLA